MIQTRIEITAKEWLRIRGIAVASGTSAQALIADALRKSPVTKQAFQREETSK